MAALLGCGPVYAADLPARVAPLVYVPPTPAVFSWTGFYLGGNAGYAFDAHSSYAFSGTGPGAIAAIAAGRRPAFAGTNADGFTGGGQVGYNYQLGTGLLPRAAPFAGSLLLGIEADAAYTDLHGGGDYFGPLGFDQTEFQSRTDFLGTVRGRVGLTFGDVLVYGTGGLAYGGVRASLNYSNGGLNTFTGGSDSIRTGYAVGGGVEYALPTRSLFNLFHSSAVTLRAEYLHYDLGTSSIATQSLFGAPGVYTAAVRNDGNIVRGAINYKVDFAAAAPPVVARY